MDIIWESIIVGIYSSIIYWSISILVFVPSWILFFVTGVLKHYIGYIGGIHELYCKYGKACQSVHKPHKNLQPPSNKSTYLWVECIIEGILYSILGSILYLFIPFRIMVVFVTGLMIHTFFEQIYLHKLFCKYRC
jgi:hypothetical protein